MNHSGDDRDDMDTDGQQQELDDWTVDRLLAGQLADPGDLRQIVELVRLASALPPPAPNAALAEILRNGLPGEPVPERQTPRVGWPMRTGLIAAALFAATFGAATANALPAPIQAIVDDIKARNPFELPSPTQRQQDVPATRSPSPPQVPEPAAVPAPATQPQEERTVLPPLSDRSGEAPVTRSADDTAVTEGRDERDEAEDDREAGTDPEGPPQPEEPDEPDEPDESEDVEGAVEVDQEDPTELTSDPED